MTGSSCRAIKLALQRHVEEFEQCDDCVAVLDILRANNIINEWNYQQINTQKTPIERNRYIDMYHHQGSCVIVITQYEYNIFVIA